MKIKFIINPISGTGKQKGIEDTIALHFDNYDIVQKNRTAIIFATKAEIKNAPTNSSEEIFELHEGTKVIILDELDNWKKIKIADGKTGWVYQDKLKEI